MVITVSILNYYHTCKQQSVHEPQVVMARSSRWRVGADMDDDMEHASTSGNRPANSRHVKSVAETSKLPPAVAMVSPDVVRNYVHSKRVENYLIGGTLGEGSFAKVKEAFHVLVGEKVQ